jgi:hypothetical protein
MFGDLFDFSFSRFVTMRLLRFLYGFALLACAIGSLWTGFVAIAAAGGFMGKLFGLAMIPLSFIVLAIMSRVWFELVMVMFKIAENTRAAADLLRQSREREGVAAGI